MRDMMTQSIVKPLWLLAIGLLIAVGVSTEAQAGENKDEVKLTGTIIKQLKTNGKPKWLIEFEDGKSFQIRTPREKSGFKLDQYIGKKVILTFMATTTNEDGKRKVTLKKTFPVAIEEVKDGQEAPPIDPDLELPGLKNRKDK